MIAEYSGLFSYRQFYEFSGSQAELDRLCPIQNFVYWWTNTVNTGRWQYKFAVSWYTWEILNLQLYWALLHSRYCPVGVYDRHRGRVDGPLQHADCG